MISIFYVIWVLFASSCLEPALKYTSESTAVLVASTPGDSLIKSLLAISQVRKVDFIRWGLTLNEGSTGAKSFVLNITFGEAQPNTLGFTGGGKKQTFKGTYTLNYTLSRRNIVQGKWAVKKGDAGNPRPFFTSLTLIKPIPRYLFWPEMKTYSFSWIKIKSFLPRTATSVLRLIKRIKFLNCVPQQLARTA